MKIVLPLQHFIDEQSKPPDFRSKKGTREHEHIVRLSAIKDGYYNPSGVLSRFSKALEDTNDAVRRQDSKGMYELMIQGAEITMAKGELPEYLHSPVC